MKKPEKRQQQQQKSRCDYEMRVLVGRAMQKGGKAFHIGKLQSFMLSRSFVFLCCSNECKSVRFFSSECVRACVCAPKILSNKLQY